MPKETSLKMGGGEVTLKGAKRSTESQEKNAEREKKKGVEGQENTLLLSGGE